MSVDERFFYKHHYFIAPVTAMNVSRDIVLLCPSLPCYHWKSEIPLFDAKV